MMGRGRSAGPNLSLRVQSERMKLETQSKVKQLEMARDVYGERPPSLKALYDKLIEKFKAPTPSPKVGVTAPVGPTGSTNK
jgi:hypothetical protein